MSMMQILLWQIRLEECQKLLRRASALFRRCSGGSDAASCAQAGQCRLGRFVLSQVCSEIRGQQWWRWLGQCMEFFYGADVGVCGLDIGAKDTERM